jgi:two-component system nitrate/nitrite response regulator NarL
MNKTPLVLVPGSTAHPGMVLGLPAKARQAKTRIPIRILLVDDHPVARKGIAFCLTRHDHLELVGEAADGLEALRKAKILLPDIVLTDIDMPQMDGLALAEGIRQDLPQVKVLVLSMHRNTAYILRVIQAGVSGYVLKDAPVEELIKAIETVGAGQAFFSPEVARVALDQFVRGSEDPGAGDLTPREQEVLIRIAEGLSNKEIASRLGLGVRTVETHRERMMRKLNIHNVAGLTKFALANGLIANRQG